MYYEKTPTDKQNPKRPQRHQRLPKKDDVL